MSRHFAAYFAIVGTLAFAPGGAANAGPPNRPLFNMLRPQPHFNILRPQISMPTPHLSNLPPLHLSNSKPRGKPVKAEDQVLHGGAGQPVTQQQSTTGKTSGNLFSNVSGGAAPSRFRVIEVTRSRFAVVEGRSENIVAAGFERGRGSQTISKRSPA